MVLQFLWFLSFAVGEAAASYPGSGARDRGLPYGADVPARNLFASTVLPDSRLPGVRRRYPTSPLDDVLDIR